MTKEQREDLLVEWGLYEARARRSMVNEYRQMRKPPGWCDFNFPDFLKDKLEIEGYWKKVGLL